MNDNVEARLSASTWQKGNSGQLGIFDRTADPTIAHIGVGAFARAHLGVYADDLLRLGYPALIRGVSIKSNRAADQLVPQDGLYTVSEREPDAERTIRLIGALPRMETGIDAAVAAAAASTTKFITLTISEKGYDVDLHDRNDPRHPVSAPGVIALALECRRQSGTEVPVVMSMDNVLDNGKRLQQSVLELAELLDSALPAWIVNEVRFPNSVVDRLVPATTTVDLEAVRAQLGLMDLAAVVSERHRSWVIESVDGLPPLAEVGVEVVGSVTPYEERKLWLLNGPHSALAYCGLLAHCSTIAAAVADTRILDFVQGYVDEVLAVADLPPRVKPTAFAREALERFGNPLLGHTCVQVGTDGSHKLPHRLLTIMTRRQQRGLDITRFATVIALWLAAVTGLRVQGEVLARVDDPASERLCAAAASGDLLKLSHAALSEQWSPLIVTEVAARLAALVQRGISLIEDTP